MRKSFSLIILYLLFGVSNTISQTTIDFSGFPSNPTQCNPFYVLTSTIQPDWKASHGAPRINQGSVVLVGDYSSTGGLNGKTDGVFIPFSFIKSRYYTITFYGDNGADYGTFSAWATRNLVPTTNSTCNQEETPINVNNAPIPRQEIRQYSFFPGTSFQCGFIPNNNFDQLWLHGDYWEAGKKGYIFIKKIVISDLGTVTNPYQPPVDCFHPKRYNDHFIDYTIDCTNSSYYDIIEGWQYPDLILLGITKSDWTQYIDGARTIRAECGIEINANFECNYGDELTVIPQCFGGKLGSYDDEIYSENFSDKESNFIAYPNPTTGTLIINTLSDFDSEVNIYDSQGQEVYKDSHNGSSFIIDLSNQDNGIYLVRVKTDSKTFNKKIIISK